MFRTSVFLFLVPAGIGAILGGSLAPPGLTRTVIGILLILTGLWAL
jgi:hypothetical protein